MVEDLSDLGSHLLPGVGGGGDGSVGGAVAEEVGHEDAVTLAGELADLETPVVAGGRETVEEEEGRVVGMGGDVQVAVGDAGGQRYDL